MKELNEWNRLLRNTHAAVYDESLESFFRRLICMAKRLKKLGQIDDDDEFFSTRELGHDCLVGCFRTVSHHVPRRRQDK